MKRVIEWWRKKPEITSEVVYDIDKDEYREEWKYETTLVEDLGEIVDLLAKEFPEHLITEGFDRSYRGVYVFHTQGISENVIRKEIKLKTLRIESEWRALREISWEVDYKEYQKVYQSPYSDYAVAVRALRDCIKENYENPAYHYIYSKYEDSINIVLNTLKDEKCYNNDEISDQVFQKSKQIIDKLGRAVKEKQAEIKHVEDLQKEAAQKSLIGRLDSELEYMEKFLEVE